MAAPAAKLAGYNGTAGKIAAVFVVFACILALFFFASEYNFAVVFALSAVFLLLSVYSTEYAIIALALIIPVSLELPLGGAPLTTFILPEIALFASVAGWQIRAIAKKPGEPEKTSRAMILAGAFALSYAGLTFAHSWPGLDTQTMKHSLDILEGFLLFAIVSKNFSGTLAKSTGMALLAGLLANSAIAFVEHNFTQGIFNSAYAFGLETTARTQSTFVYINAFSAYLTLLLPLAAIAAICGGKKTKILGIASFLLGIFALAYTATRASQITLIFIIPAVMALAIIGKFRKTHSQKHLSAAVLLVLIVFAAAIMIVLPAYGKNSNQYAEKPRFDGRGLFPIILENLALHKPYAYGFAAEGDSGNALLTDGIIGSEKPGEGAIFIPKGKSVTIDLLAEYSVDELAMPYWIPENQACSGINAEFSLDGVNFSNGGTMPCEKTLNAEATLSQENIKARFVRITPQAENFYTREIEAYSKSVTRLPAIGDIVVFRRIETLNEDFGSREHIFWNCAEESLKSPIIGRGKKPLEMPDRQSLDQIPVKGLNSDITSAWVGQWFKSLTDKSCPPNSHNVLIQIFVEGGIIALGVFLALLLYVLAAAGKLVTGSWKQDWAKTGLAMGVIAFLIGGITEDVLFWNKNLLVFWLVAAIILSKTAGQLEITNQGRPPAPSKARKKSGEIR